MFASDWLREESQRWGIETLDHLDDVETMGCQICGARLINNGHPRSYIVVMWTCGAGPMVHAVICGYDCLKRLASGHEVENKLLHLEDWEI